MPTFENLRSYAVSVPIEGGELGPVEPGDTVEVPDDIAEGMREQTDAWRETTGGDTRRTVDEVLDDVGDDPDKARTALAVEQQDGKPRKTLVQKLEEIIASSEETV